MQWDPCFSSSQAMVPIPLAQGSTGSGGGVGVGRRKPKLQPQTSEQERERGEIYHSIMSCLLTGTSQSTSTPQTLNKYSMDGWMDE